MIFINSFPGRISPTYQACQTRRCTLSFLGFYTVTLSWYTACHKSQVPSLMTFKLPSLMSWDARGQLLCRIIALQVGNTMDAPTRQELIHRTHGNRRVRCRIAARIHCSCTSSTTRAQLDPTLAVQVRRRWMVHYKSRVAKGRSYSSLVFFWGTSSSASRRFLEEESRFVLSSG